MIALFMHQLQRAPFNLAEYITFLIMDQSRGLAIALAMEIRSSKGVVTQVEQLRARRCRVIAQWIDVAPRGNW